MAAIFAGVVATRASLWPPFDRTTASICACHLQQHPQWLQHQASGPGTWVELFINTTHNTYDVANCSVHT